MKRFPTTRWVFRAQAAAVGLMLLGACSGLATTAQPTTAPKTNAPAPASTDPCVDPAASLQACVDSLGGSNAGTTGTDTTPVDTTMRVYYVVKSAAGVDTITYNDGNDNIQQDTTGKWSRWVSKTFTVAGDGTFFASVSGQNQGGGTITCQVFGISAGQSKWHLVNQGVSRGEYAICDASTSV